MTKAVIDTNVIVSSLIQPLGKPAAILDMVMAEEVEPVVNEAVLAEYADVLNRPKFGFPEALVSGFVDYLKAKSTRCLAIPQPETLPDPDDKVFWDLAVTSNAILVTGNTKHFPSNSEIVMTPARFLEHLASDRRESV